MCVWGAPRCSRFEPDAAVGIVSITAVVLCVGFCSFANAADHPPSFDTHFRLVTMLRKVLSWFGLKYVGSSSREEPPVDPPEPVLSAPWPARLMDPQHSFYPPYTQPSLPNNLAQPSQFLSPHVQQSRHPQPQDYGPNGGLPPPYPFAWPYAAPPYLGTSSVWPPSSQNFPPWFLPSHSGHAFDPSNVPPSYAPKREVPIPPIPHSKTHSGPSGDSGSIPTTSRMAAELDVSAARSPEAVGTNGGRHGGHGMPSTAPPEDALLDTAGE